MGLFLVDFVLFYTSKWYTHNTTVQGNQKRGRGYTLMDLKADAQMAFGPLM